jgi:PIN like domain
MIQPQAIAFFIDRCLGNKRIAQTLRDSGMTVEIHDEHFAKGAQDVEWLPEVGKRG